MSETDVSTEDLASITIRSSSEPGVSPYATGVEL